MGGGGKGSSNTSDTLSDIAQAFFTETTPLRQELTSQFLEALTTGGVSARMPIISKAEEASRRATSQSLQGLEEQLALTGLAGTPFGESQRQQSRQQGEQAVSQIGPQFIASVLSQIPGFITGSNQVTVSGLGSAAGAEAQQAGAQAAWLGSLLSPFSFGFGSGG